MSPVEGVDDNAFHRNTPKTGADDRGIRIGVRIAKANGVHRAVSNGTTKECKQTHQSKRTIFDHGSNVEIVDRAGKHPFRNAWSVAQRIGEKSIHCLEMGKKSIRIVRLNL